MTYETNLHRTSFRDISLKISAKKVPCKILKILSLPEFVYCSNFNPNILTLVQYYIIPKFHAQFLIYWISIIFRELEISVSLKTLYNKKMPCSLGFTKLKK
jgi:hypothetical protein